MHTHAAHWGFLGGLGATLKSASLALKSADTCRSGAHGPAAAALFASVWPAGGWCATVKATVGLQL